MILNFFFFSNLFCLDCFYFLCEVKLTHFRKTWKTGSDTNELIVTYGHKRTQQLNNALRAFPRNRICCPDKKTNVMLFEKLIALTYIFKVQDLSSSYNKISNKIIGRILKPTAALSLKKAHSYLAQGKPQYAKRQPNPDKGLGRSKNNYTFFYSAKWFL